MQPYSRVTAPTTVTAVRPAWLRSYSGLDLAIRYTPAVTMVAAWMGAETGVGPSIASGNQVCSGNCPDLPQAPSSSSSVIATSIAADRWDAPAKTPSKEVVPSVANISMTASDSPTSPIRFITNAFLPAVAATGLVNQ